MDKGISVAVATSVGLGAIVGAGIYVLSGTAIAIAGAYALVSFLFVGIVALLIAYHIAKLGEIMPHEKGASYSFAFNAFGSELGFITGILLYFSYAVAISAIATGFGSYLASMLGISVGNYSQLFAIFLIVLLSIVNVLGIKKAAKADFWLVLVKISVLLLFALFAIVVTLPSGFAVLHNFYTQPSKSTLSAMFDANVAIFFAYTGFQAISTFTDKVKGGAKGARKAIMYAVLISILLYMLVAAGLMMLKPANTYEVNADPLSAALSYARAPQWFFVVVDIGALIATTSATLAMILTSSRTLYQISEDRLLPRFFRKYNKSKDVAINGVIVSAAISIIMLYSGNIYVIAAISNFGLLFAYLMSVFATMHFKRRMKERLALKFYPYVQVVTIIAILSLFVGMPREALVLGVTIILSLIIVYYSLREMKGEPVVKVRLFK